MVKKYASLVSCALAIGINSKPICAQALIPSIHLLLLEDVCGAETALLYDDFSCDRVFVDSSPWSFVNRDGVEAYVDDDELVFELISQLLWFNNSQGIFMHREITGDFKATTSLRVHQTSDQALLPNGPVQLAGLMARDPSSDTSDENYVFIVLGYDVNDISIETKTTVNGVSDFEGPSWESGEAELRLCRLGDQFYTYKRPGPDQDWQVADTAGGIDWPMVRPDLAETLQLGLNIYTSTANFDITARFDYFHATPVTELADCTNES